MIYKNKMCFLSVVLMTLLIIACDSEDLTAPTVFNESDFSSVSYAFVGLNQNDIVVILGQLTFAKLEELYITGTWHLETWGEQPQFPHLPADGTLSGTIHGDLAIINIDLPETEEFIGLLSEGFREDKLVGTLTVHPDSKFRGRFEAIRK